MNTLKLPAKILQAARYFQAKQDVRFYLKGIFVTPSGKVYSSNGHQLFRAIIEKPETSDLAHTIDINVHGAKFPIKAHTAVLKWEECERSGMIQLLDINGKQLESAGIPVLRTFSFIEGKMPDFDKVIDGNLNQEVGMAEPFGVNPEYFSSVAKAVKSMGCMHSSVKVTSTSPNMSIRVEPDGFRHYKEAEVLFLIMPTHLGN